MKLTLIDIDDWAQNLKEVTDTKIKGSTILNKSGLFSQKIFGPTNSYECGCRTNYHLVEKGETCPVCGVDVVNSSERRKRFAKIELPFPIFNPIFYLMLEKKKNIITMIDDMLSYKHFYIFVIFAWAFFN